MIDAPPTLRCTRRGPRRHARGAAVLAICGAAAAAASAQAPGMPPAEAAAPAAPASAPAAAATRLDRVEVRGARASEADERQRSTAAKIVVGREDIERYGDATVGEVLRRLPGVTLQGAPGRGGGVRMRGLGGGYTQILLDGERVPPGFTLEALSPEQVERIELYRAPTAETGARAIAGTINIITRGGYRRRLNEVRASGTLANGRFSPGLSWTRNDSAGDWTWNVSLSAFHSEGESRNETVTTRHLLGDPSAVTLSRRETGLFLDRRSGLHLTSRLQWRGEGGESLVLTPFLVHSSGSSRRAFELQQGIGPTPPRYDRAAGEETSDYTAARLGGQWTRRVGDTGRLEGRFSLGGTHNPVAASATEFAREAGSDPPERVVRTTAMQSITRDRSASGTLKYSTLLAAGHDLVAGVETETTRRQETYSNFQDGQPILRSLAGDVAASTARLAAYAQDEWTIGPQWSAHAGLRWEGIATRADDVAGDERRNTSSVWTPLLHAVWKPSPDSRDRVRLSLTRSYRSPSLIQLTARPAISSRFPLGGPNEPTAPDRAGNPDLRPELATGLDLAVERYLPAGGVLSAGVFHRHISDVIRHVITSQPVEVAWSPNQPRYVVQPRNVGNAVTQGVELEAKFRLDALATAAPPIDLRSNLAFYRSRVSSVPGPDNRLEQQPHMSANLGADWRLRGLPLSLGADVHWNPAYDIRLSETQTVFQGRKRVIDLRALWVFDPTVQLRLTASNVAPLDYVTAVAIDTPTERETARTVGRSYTQWQLRLEVKL